MEYESDGETSCDCCSWYSHQRIGTETMGLGNKRTRRDHLNYSIVEIGQNTEKSPGDLRRLDVTQTTTNPSQSGPGSNGNEGIFDIPQGYRSGASPSGSLESYPEHSLCCRSLFLYKSSVSVFNSSSRLSGQKTVGWLYFTAYQNLWFI